VSHVTVFQIAELQKIHSGLAEVSTNGDETVLKGPLCFAASTDGLDTITECFEIEIVIPEKYPEVLPYVREIGGKMDVNYAHIHKSGTLCLAVPIEERRVFLEQPSLLGFVNMLVIPYFYGYCHWKKHGVHPFGESEHGSQGIVRYYMDALGLTDKLEVLAFAAFLYEYGYRGHHPCPCGSGKKVRKCHGKVLRDLHDKHTQDTLKTDFLHVLNICSSAIESNSTDVPMSLRHQIVRLLDRHIKSARSNAIALLTLCLILMVEAAGIEPASTYSTLSLLHV